MSRKSIICLALGIFLLLISGVGAYYIYWSHHPHVMIIRGETYPSNRFEEEYYCETIVVTLASHKSWIPLAKSVDANLKEFADWNDQVVTDLHGNYIAPYNIKVSGEVVNGKTTLRYEGYVTTLEGETIDYKEEMTFDFAYVSNENLFKNNIW